MRELRQSQDGSAARGALRLRRHGTGHRNGHDAIADDHRPVSGWWVLPMFVLGLIFWAVMIRAAWQWIS